MIKRRFYWLVSSLHTLLSQMSHSYLMPIFQHVHLVLIHILQLLLFKFPRLKFQFVKFTHESGCESLISRVGWFSWCKLCTFGYVTFKAQFKCSEQQEKCRQRESVSNAPLLPLMPSRWLWTSHWTPSCSAEAAHWSTVKGCLGMYATDRKAYLSVATENWCSLKCFGKGELRKPCSAPQI